MHVCMYTIALSEEKGKLFTVWKTNIKIINNHSILYIQMSFQEQDKCNIKYNTSPYSTISPW